MKERLLNYLSCPSCAGAIALTSASHRESEEIIAGQLSCSSCARAWPVTRGVPRFASLDEVEAEKAATAAGFGWQWQHFTQTDDKYEQQFLGWIAPLTPEFFKNKVVLEGGCGKGRHTRFARAFDYAFSIGVLHHLPDPRGGFKSLASKVKPGGHLSAWVYGAENNEWITRWVNPLRRGLTSRMNPRSLLQLSKLPAAIMFAATKLIYGPLNRSARGASLARHLFYNDYLGSIAPFGWREQHTIVFDHLVAPTAFYISREEFADWWREIGAGEVNISWHNSNSWRGFGRI